MGKQVYYAAIVNILHRRYCRSDAWRQAVHHGMMPWVLGEVDLGANVLEIGPGPGVTTDWLRERVPSLTCVEIDRKLANALKARLEGTNVTVVEGDATAMEFADATFDTAVCFTMLHHVPARALQDSLLAEAHRVLKPGGRFYCLEFSKVTLAPVGRVYDAYSSRALPFFGRIIAKDAESYRYLHESIRRFPPQRELARRMREVGFANVAWRDMTLGVVALHSGWRI